MVQPREGEDETLPPCRMRGVEAADERRKSPWPGKRSRVKEARATPFPLRDTEIGHVVAIVPPERDWMGGRVPVAMGGERCLSFFLFSLLFVLPLRGRTRELEKGEPEYGSVFCRSWAAAVMIHG